MSMYLQVRDLGRVAKQEVCIDIKLLLQSIFKDKTYIYKILVT